MKYITTINHPTYKNELIIDNSINNEFAIYSRYGDKENFKVWKYLQSEIVSLWLEKGWIKEYKEKVWIIDKSDNLKLFKITKEHATYNDIEIFKSKKKALEFVLKEAKKRFIYKFEFNKEFSVLDGIYHVVKSDFKITKHDGKKAISNGMYYLWYEHKGWIAEPKNVYPTTDKEIIDFAPKEHFCINSLCEIKESRKSVYYLKNSIPTKELAISFLSLMKLIKFRNAWWEVDNWKPDYKIGKKMYSIKNSDNIIYIKVKIFESDPLIFKSEETAKDFLESFKEDIEISKELL